MFLAETHGPELRHFSVGTTMLQLSDAAYLCDKFPNLEEITCSIYNADAVDINASSTETVLKLTLTIILLTESDQ